MKVKTIVAAAAAAGLIAALYSTPVHAEAVQAAPQTEVQPTVTNVTVQSGDSLSKIAAAHQTTYRRLFDANPNVEHPDLIHPGEVLRVPPAGEQLASRPLPGARQTSVAPAQNRAVTASAVASKPKTYARAAASGDVWDRLARCESSGNWAINTGNGYYGGLQFHAQTWRGYGGTEFAPYAHQASREQQIVVAERVLAKQGWKAWPACTAKLGLR